VFKFKIWQHACHRQTFLTSDKQYSFSAILSNYKASFSAVYYSDVFFLYHPICIFLAKAQLNYLQIHETHAATSPQAQYIEHNENSVISQ
jgi:hypothetical protein